MPSPRRGKRKRSVKNSKKPAISRNEAEEKNGNTAVSQLEILKDAIAKVKNLSWNPSVYVFDVESEDSLCAVDLTKNHSLVACAFEKSGNIYIHSQPEESLPQADDENLLANYNTLRVAKEYLDTISENRRKNKYLFGHSMPVTGLKFVEGKDLLLSSSLDATVRAWNTEKLTQVKVYSGIFDDFLLDLDVSSNSSHFVTSGVKGTVYLFSFELSQPDRFYGHTEDVNCVRFHPNGIYVASASADKTIKLWCTQSGNTARTFQDDEFPRTLAFSPDGKYLASYSGGLIKIWDLASGRLLTSLLDSINVSASCSLIFSQFGGVLASGGKEKELKLWDVNNFLSNTQEDSFNRDKKPLLKNYNLSKKIKHIKFDENNYFTCITG